PAGAKVWYGHAPGPWNKPVYADSLYGAPVLAMLHKATGDRQYLDILNGAFWDVTDKVLDKDEDLYYRDPAYIGRKSPNGGKILWSRG
ncbi:MAG: glycoside hydrolase family 88 protein, partial [Phycisphaerae bacterium]|nr:glycoside hydrolase family 88 protein [Phycisphaerae bacterium]